MINSWNWLRQMMSYQSRPTGSKICPTKDLEKANSSWIAVICVQAGFNFSPLVFTRFRYPLVFIGIVCWALILRGIWTIFWKRRFVSSTENCLAGRCRKGGRSRKWSFFFSSLVGILETPSETFYCFHHIYFYSSLYIRNNWTNDYLSHRLWVIAYDNDETSADMFHHRLMIGFINFFALLIFLIL